MPVLSDKWIKKNAKSKGMIKPFVSEQVEKERSLLDYLHMGTMLEYQMSSKFLPMLIQV